MISIKILGSGCKKCQTLESKVKEFITANGFDAEVEKVTDLNNIMEYGILMTPGLVVNEEVKSVGIIPSESQLHEWIKA
jgi:small redox-active disulfide protein 2